LRALRFLERSMTNESGDVSDRNWFWRVDARAKFIGVVALVVATAILARTDLLVAALVTSLALAAASRVPPMRLAKAFVLAVPFIMLTSVSVFLFAGFAQGVNLLIRASSCVLCLLVLAHGTETFDLFAGMRRLKVPALLTTVLMLTEKYILVLAEELARMNLARRARGFAPGRTLLDRHGLRVLSYTAGMVLVRSSARADMTYEGLRARGFNGEMPAVRTVRTGATDAAFLAVLMAIALVLTALQLEVVL